jgi:hypothetical protein
LGCTTITGDAGLPAGTAAGFAGATAGVATGSSLNSQFAPPTASTAPIKAAAAVTTMWLVEPRTSRSPVLTRM